MTPDVTIVFGCYNAVRDLRRTIPELCSLLAKRGQSYEIVAVEDGSADATLNVLHELESVHPGVRVLRNPRNMGKGFSIRNGILNSTGRFVVFVDTDMAYSLNNVAAVLDQLSDGAELVVGNRRLPESVYTVNNTLIRYVYRRHKMGASFNLMVRLLYGIGIRDTQSGLKGFQRSVANRVFEQIYNDGFLFDVEIFIRAAALRVNVSEIPVHVTYDTDESTVRNIAVVIQLLPELARIKWRQLTGAYGERVGRPSSASTA